MNIKPATTHPLATQEIGGMIDMIQTLIDKGYAYECQWYCILQNKKVLKDMESYLRRILMTLEAGHRDDAHRLKVSGEDEKEDPLDFVLWKPKEGRRAFIGRHLGVKDVRAGI